MTEITGPAWDNTTEYPSLAAPEFSADQAALEKLMVRIHEVSAKLKSDAGALERLVELTTLGNAANVLHRNLKAYVGAELSVDGRSAEAKRLNAELQATGARLESALKVFEIFLIRAPQPLIDQYLAHKEMAPETFQVEQIRLLKPTLLSEGEEILLSSLGVNGHFAWDSLYNDISSSMKCKIASSAANGDGSGVGSGRFAESSIGLSEAASRLRMGDTETRRAAWHGIQDAWSENGEACAGILNALAGWRLDIASSRSHTVPVNFMAEPLHFNRVKLATVEAMFAAVGKSAEVARSGVRGMARVLGKTKLDPWDLLAPPPSASSEDQRLPFLAAVELIAETFSAVDPELGDFVRMMHKNRWIEGRVHPNKRQGAYCMKFTKSRTPRVFLTYAGSRADIKTLAHELGHAYHGWVMRDLSRSECQYPMTLAETASLFGETVLRDGLLSEAGGREEKIAAGWCDAQEAASFLLNIPARYEFERRFYEQRRTMKFAPEEFSNLMESAWRQWYGDSLSETERMFWASKLHFHIAGRSFYNFPYTFGFLFSQRIYSLRAELGRGFMPVYKAILRDTGRMTAEQLVQKHLGEDIRDEAFWRRGLAIVEKQVGEFLALV